MGLNDFKLEETQGSGVAFPFVKSSIHSVFQDFSRRRITFFQVKMYSGLFLTVTYNLMYGKIAKASIILVLLSNSRDSPGHLKYCYFKTFPSLETDIGDNSIFPYFQNL